MGAHLPEYYFRTRENGAAVFRVDTENRYQRIEMNQIAVVNVKNGEVKPNGSHELSENDKAAIQNWLDDRIALLEQRNIDEIHRAIDCLNQTAHWVQSKASDEELELITDSMLLAMHDLRTVLTRKKSDRLRKSAKG